MWANRTYRRVKTYLLTHRTPVITPLFFRALSRFERALSNRQMRPVAGAGEEAWRRSYLEAWRTDARLRFRVETEFPVADYSDDHRHPRGAVCDNTVHPAFNRKVYEFLGYPQSARFLDLGCAGGGLVRSYLADGHAAIGIDGSDEPRRRQLGEWNTIPHNLFTADITRPFQIYGGDDRPSVFDVITAWEVLEHIPTERLDGLLDNIARHLAPGGFFIGSVDTLPDENPLLGAVYHHTLQPREWWEARFAAHGLVPVAQHPFRSGDMVRGNGLSIKDWRPEDGTGFHLVLRMKDR